MNTRILKYLVALAALLLVHGRALAEDTDLFASTKPAKPANILLIFDNGASFGASTTDFCNISASGTVTVGAATADKTALGNTAGGIEQCAMYAALKSIEPSDNIKIGMMMFNAGKIYDPSTGTFTGTCNGTTGGCLVLPMRAWNATVKTNTLSWIRQWAGSGNSNYVIKGPSSTSNGGIMQEAWAFYKGGTGISGVQYTAPDISCGSNSIIYVGNDFRNNTSPGDQTGSKGPKDPLEGVRSGSFSVASPAATQVEKTYFSTLGSVLAKYKINANTTITCTSGTSSSVTYDASVTENSGAYSINWSKYMFDTMGIQTTTIALLSSDCNPNYSTQLDQIAKASDKTFIPTTDYAGLAGAVSGAVSSIISTNSVFASVSLPVSVNQQSKYLNQVFIGMFRPDGQFRPRWPGNLKQYKIAFTDATKSELQLVDADGEPTVNSSTGFIAECNRSFWTPTVLNTYWNLDPNGSCTLKTGATRAAGGAATAADLAGSDFPDGNIVEKGGQAFKLRSGSPSSRTVKTCGTSMGTCTSSLDDFTTTLSPTVFGLASNDSATRDSYVNWARGQNVKGDETAAPVASSAMRPSVHGDVVHSRPVAVDYGGSTGVVVYYGANDGMLHSINGNQTATFTLSGTDYAPGQELWSFMPPEFYASSDNVNSPSNLANIYNNSAFVFYKGTVSTPTIAKPYGMDGPMVAIQNKFGGSSTKSYLVATMRRGGRALYAFDVSTPNSPTLLWKKGCSSASASNTDCSDNTSHGYRDIGQTWAPAKVILTSQRVHGDGTSKPLLLMGGGYDPCEDVDTGSANNNCGSSGATKGSQVYVIDASDGSIVRSFPTVTPYNNSAARGVVAEPTVVNSRGVAQYAYIADLGGVVYRISFTGDSKDDWRMTPIAKLGCNDISAGCTANRKFMFQPSVVSSDGVNFTILVGSGDREKPTTQYTASNGITNYFFAVKDQPGVSNYLDNACNSNNYICLSSLLQITSLHPSASALGEKKGWYLPLATKEQVVTSAVTLFGVTSFSTHAPAVLDPSNLCANPGLGTTLVYNINFTDASPASGDSRYARVDGDGLPPPPVAGTVTVDGTDVAFCIGCKKDPIDPKKAKQSTSITRAKGRLYWYIEKN
jgi:type IV pilus assembly protein PilY1